MTKNHARKIQARNFAEPSDTSYNRALNSTRRRTRNQRPETPTVVKTPVERTSSMFDDSPIVDASEVEVPIGHFGSTEFVFPLGRESSTCGLIHGRSRQGKTVLVRGAVAFAREALPDAEMTIVRKIDSEWESVSDQVDEVSYDEAAGVLKKMADGLDFASTRPPAPRLLVIDEVTTLHPDAVDPMIRLLDVRSVLGLTILITSLAPFGDSPNLTMPSSMRRLMTVADRLALWRVTFSQTIGLGDYQESYSGAGGPKHKIRGYAE
ncbi:ATP-binding protein [Brevibacterium sp. FAM 24638]|uniref:ATP-binding protein n=1 Tax=Brevibacterium sp. FAM 24638 TaxID=3415681 RepID=UPI003C7D7A6F